METRTVNAEVLNDLIQINNDRVAGYEKAIEELEKALKFTDDFADVYNLMGMEYLFMDDLEKAKEYFIKCLEEDEEDYCEYNSEDDEDFDEDDCSKVTAADMNLDDDLFVSEVLFTSAN